MRLFLSVRILNIHMIERINDQGYTGADMCKGPKTLPLGETGCIF